MSKIAPILVAVLLLGCKPSKSEEEPVAQPSCLPELNNRYFESSDNQRISVGGGMKAEAELNKFLKKLADVNLGIEAWIGYRDSLHQVLREERFFSQKYLEEYKSFRDCYCEFKDSIPQEMIRGSREHHSYKMQLYSNCRKYGKPLGEDPSIEYSTTPVRPEDSSHSPTPSQMKSPPSPDKEGALAYVYSYISGSLFDEAGMGQANVAIHTNYGDTFYTGVNGRFLNQKIRHEVGDYKIKLVFGELVTHSSYVGVNQQNIHLVKK